MYGNISLCPPSKPCCQRLFWRNIGYPVDGMGSQQALLRACVRECACERSRCAVCASVQLSARGALQGLKSEEHVLLVRKNATEARNLLIQHNVRLVISMAKNYRWRGVELQDLIQEGIMGLVRAIDRFEPDRGFKFSTYAHWWIRQVPLPAPMVTQSLSLVSSDI